MFYWVKTVWAGLVLFETISADETTESIHYSSAAFLNVELLCGRMMGQLPFETCCLFSKKLIYIMAQADDSHPGSLKLAAD